VTLDPSAKAVLDLLDELGMPAIEDMEPEVARSAFDAMRDPDAPLAEVAATADLELAEVPCRIYTPVGTGLHPVLIWIHGGGWVIGSVEQSDPTARELCARAGVVVVSIDYRLAPEDKFPAAVDDVLTVCDWVADHAVEIGGDPARLAVGGDSAGGQLAAVATQQLQGTFAFQVLIYPVTDLTMSHPSVEENANGYLLQKGSIEYFRDHWLESTGASLEDPRVSPLHAPAEMFATLPPAFVVTCGYDPLRDEGAAYAERLRAAGVEVEHRHEPGQIHAFYGMHQAIPEADAALDATAAALRQVLVG
jgi:acetyl esterase